MWKVEVNVRCDERQVRAGGGNAGFSLIEMLVVIAIIVLLIAIVVPIAGSMRDRSRAAATLQMLSAIRMGLERYHQDFGMYPPSTAYGVLTSGRGAAVLLQGVQGYLPAVNDGADGNGFRTKGSGAGALGNKYGPYFEASGNNLRVNSATDQVVVDWRGNEILYYAATSRQAVPTPANVFGAATDSYFVEADNPGAVTTAAKPAFWQKLGVTSNTASTGTVLGRNSFILISAGADDTYFTEDDIVVGGP